MENHPENAPAALPTLESASAAPVGIALLGGLKVTVDGQVMALPPSRKCRALIAWLAMHQRPQRREVLCSLFWQVPDDPRGASSS